MGGEGGGVGGARAAVGWGSAQNIDDLAYKLFVGEIVEVRPKLDDLPGLWLHIDDLGYK